MEYLRFNDGRLGNQLYYALQSYILNKKGLNVRYSMRERECGLGYYDFMCSLGLSDYLTKEEPHRHIDSYVQKLGTDFSYDDINSFIKNTILCSNAFNGQSEIDYENGTAIHIRNGDYLKIPIYQCFNREEYITNASKYVKNDTIYVFSDDIPLVRKMYDGLFRSIFKNVNYELCGSYQSDFINLSLFKNKILWNSTFSYWSGFIGDVHYNFNTNVTVPFKYMTNVPIYGYVSKKWAVI